MTRALWFDFRTNTANDEVLEFSKFSKLMKLDTSNDVQLLNYEIVNSQHIQRSENT